MSRCVIAGAAEIGDYDRIKPLLKTDDFFIFCDGGLAHEAELGVSPNLIVGDFDSFQRPDTKVETITLPTAKDDTDVFYAVKEAIKRGFRDFLLVGCAGGRLDHTMVNISVLLYLDSQGCHGVMADDYSLTEIISGTAYIPGSFAYFSVLALDEELHLSIRNAMFPLENSTIQRAFQYGISNQVLPGRTAEVCITKGTALLVKVF